VSQRSVFDYKRALAPKGICVLIGGSGRAVFVSLLLGPWAIGDRKVTLLLYRPDPHDSELICDMIGSGKLIPIIDRRFPLSQVADAFRYYAEGNVKGKIILTVQ